MAPSGYKTFSAGAVLTATADVQNYLMDQAVTVHNDASARSSAISSPAEGQVSYLKDTNKVYLYNGSAWEEVGGGIAWSGSTANGLGTFGSSSSIVSESSATYDGTTLQLTTSGGGLKLDNLAPSEANTLGDYEIGTCEIGLTPAGGGSITVHPDDAGYTKIGRMVTVGARVFVQSISSPSGSVRMTGLPFIVKADEPYEPVGSGYMFSVSSGAGGLSLTAGQNTTQAYLYMTDGNSIMQGGVIQASSEFQFTITYATTA